MEVVLVIFRSNIFIFLSKISFLNLTIFLKNFFAKNKKKVHLKVDLVCFDSDWHSAKILFCDTRMSQLINLVCLLSYSIPGFFTDSADEIDLLLESFKVLSAFFGKTKDVNGFWQVTFSSLDQDIGQEASYTRLSVAFGSH